MWDTVFTTLSSLSLQRIPVRAIETLNHDGLSMGFTPKPPKIPGWESLQFSCVYIYIYMCVYIFNTILGCSALMAWCSAEGHSLWNHERQFGDLWPSNPGGKHRALGAPKPSMIPFPFFSPSLKKHPQLCTLKEDHSQILLRSLNFRKMLHFRLEMQPQLG